MSCLQRHTGAHTHQGTRHRSSDNLLTDHTERDRLSSAGSQGATPTLSAPPLKKVYLEVQFHVVYGETSMATVELGWVRREGEKGTDRESRQIAWGGGAPLTWAACRCCNRKATAVTLWLSESAANFQNTSRKFFGSDIWVVA